MWKDVFAAFLALVITLMFGGVLAILLTQPPTLSEGATALVNMSFGFLGAAFGAVWNYYFGSSASSQKANETIHQALVGTGSSSITSTDIETGKPPVSTNITKIERPSA